MAADLGQQLGDPDVGLGLSRQHRDLPVDVLGRGRARVVQVRGELQLGHQCRRARPGRPCCTANTSAASISPAFIVWIASPDSGTSTTTVVSASFTDVELGLAHPDRLHQHPVVAEGRQQLDALRRWRAARPPSEPWVAIERMNTPGSSACACMRMRSPSTAPPVNGLEGSTATIPTVALVRAQVRGQAIHHGGLPAPGRPGDAHHVGRAGPRINSLHDRGHRRGSGSRPCVMSRASASRSP